MNKVLPIKIDDIEEKPLLIKALKRGIWLYFLLIVFEGALRKWILPSLSTPLLVVRDPIAIWLIYKSWKHNIVSFNAYILVIGFVSLFGICTALIIGHGSLSVAIFGARIFLIHFPLIFIIGQIFNSDDVIKLGKVLMWIAIPMAILIALQFYSPQTDWVNRGIGGDTEGAGFSGALGFFRPPGTFSFTTGNVMFFSLVACYLFYFWLEKTEINRLVLIAATFSLLAAIPLSISRTLMFSIGFTFLFSLVSVFSKPKFLVRMIVFLLLGVLVVLILSQTPFFETSSDVMLQRFENASKSEGTVTDSILDRFLGGMITAITGSHELPFFGYGIGMGTNAGAALLTGERMFLIAEGEWLRIVGEMGFVMGLIVILIRVILSTELIIKCYKNLRLGNLLPWLLLSSGLLYVLQGQWSQPTVLGFSTLIGGLIIAAFKTSSEIDNN